MERNIATEEPSSLADYLVTDFYLSFLVSQGRDRHQRRYYKMLAYQYNKHAMLDEAKSEVTFQYFMDTCKDLTIPGSHVEFSGYGEVNDSVEETIQKQFTTQGELFMRQLQKSPLSDKRYEYDIERASIMMMGIDAHYIQHGRPGSRDKHASLYREYVLKRRKVGSVAFSAIVADMHATYSHHQNSVYFDALVEKWESAHPGRNFFDI